MDLDYRINNESQSKCDLTIVFNKISPAELVAISTMVKKLTQIVVKEDVVFVRDGAVAEYKSDGFVVGIGRCSDFAKSHGPKCAIYFIVERRIVEARIGQGRS